jgi:hypothetical protein
MFAMVRFLSFLATKRELKNLLFCVNNQFDPKEGYHIILLSLFRYRPEARFAWLNQPVCRLRTWPKEACFRERVGIIIIKQPQLPLSRKFIIQSRKI